MKAVALLIVSVLVVSCANDSRDVQASSNEIRYVDPPDNFLGIKFQTSDDELLAQLTNLFGREPSMTMETGRGVQGEYMYYVISDTLCDFPCTFWWWIGSNGFTALDMEIVGTPQSVENCLWSLLPLQDASYQDGIIYMWCHDELMRTECAIGYDAQKTVVALTTGYKFRNIHVMRKYARIFDIPKRVHG